MTNSEQNAMYSENLMKYPRNERKNFVLTKLKKENLECKQNDAVQYIRQNCNVQWGEMYWKAIQWCARDIVFYIAVCS